MALHTVLIRYSQFDMVHARLVGSGLKDFKKCKEEIGMCLKPGGIIVSHVNEDYMHADCGGSRFG